MNYSIHIDSQNLSIFKQGKGLYIYTYNTYYYCFLRIGSGDSIKLTNNCSVKFTNNTKSDNKNFNKIISRFLNQFILLQYTKIKFAGKGYKIKKNTKQSLILLFNRAHITIVGWKNIIVIKLKKYKLYIKYNFLNSKSITKLITVRSINMFTKKGLRKSRQIILKKKGKK